MHACTYTHTYMHIKNAYMYTYCRRGWANFRSTNVKTSRAQNGTKYMSDARGECPYADVDMRI